MKKNSFKGSASIGNSGIKKHLGNDDQTGTGSRATDRALSVSTMATRLPQRPRAHELEVESEKYFRQNLPAGWTCDKPQHDYGVDLRLGLTTDGRITGQQLVVQLKASEIANTGDYVVVRLKVTTLAMLRQMLEVAMLVKYIMSEGEAYWLLLKDFTAEPMNGQKTVSVRIPKVNRLSENPWPLIGQHVNDVHFRKLNANRPGHPQQ